MNFNQSNKYLACMAIPLAIAGCGSAPRNPLSFSIEQLGAEAATRNDESLGYRSSVSVTGITQPISSGNLLSVPGRGLPDVLSVPITTTCSRVLETVYDSTATDSDVRDLAVAIEKLRTALINKAIAESRLQLISIAKSSYKKLKASNIEPNDDQAMKSIAASLGITQVDDAALLAAEQAVNKDISSEKQNSDTSADLVSKISSKTNVFIFRWALDSGKSASTGIGSLFSSALSSSDSRNGYLVAASLRSSSIEYGDDLTVKLNRDKQFGISGADAVLKNTYIVNFTIGAKHHYFSEDRDISGAISAALKASPEDLNKIFGAGVSSLLKAQALAIDLTLKNSLAASARGLASAPKRSAYPFRLWGDWAFSAAAEAERKRSNGYTVFYSTRTNLNSYSGDRLVAIGSAAQFQCMQNVPFQGSVNSTSITAVGYKFCAPLGWDSDEGRVKLSKIYAGDWKPDPKSCIEFDKEIQ
jgi:hypothetical protein